MALLSRLISFGASFLDESTFAQELFGAWISVPGHFILANGHEVGHADGGGDALAVRVEYGTSACKDMKKVRI